MALGYMNAMLESSWLAVWLSRITALRMNNAHQRSWSTPSRVSTEMGDRLMTCLVNPVTRTVDMTKVVC